MSATVTLPSSLSSRLGAIQRRLRLLRAVRGLALLVVVLGLFAGAALLADHWLTLSALTRQILFSVWLAMGVGLLLRGVLAPLCRHIDAAALAAVIEEKYPDLGERLTSAVELADTSEAGHGSPILIALLLEETATRSEQLDFRPAVPSRRTGILAALAAAMAVLLAAPGLVWPQQYRDLAERFLSPWNIAPVPPPYDIAVTSGDVIAARGRTVALSARLTPRNETIALPATATLVVVDSNGKETRQPMPRAENGDFTLSYKVAADVSYRVEAGEVASDAHRVTAVTPVELAAESPAITITPPAYARSAREEETFRGLVDVSALRHSDIRFDFRFTRPAVAAYLEWITEERHPSPPAPLPSGERGVNAAPLSPLGRGVGGEGKSVAKIVRHPLIVSDDRQAAVFRMPALQEGKYRLILEAEHEIRTELAGGSIHIQPDQPPSVLRFNGKEELRSVMPYDRVPLQIEATDDIAVTGVELEYRVNDGQPVRQPLQLQGGNTPSAVAQHVLELAGKVKEEDRFAYRFRVTDNLPKEFQGPHVVVYPADRWLMLKIARRGDPLKQQEIISQRDEINRRLETIRQALLQEKRHVYRVQQDTRNLAALMPDDLDSVKDLQRENRSNEKALREAAERAGETPVLQPVADLARDLADQEMHRSQQALEQVPRQETPADRTRKFWKADEELESAVKRLAELKKLNDRLAQERLDQAKLETLAEREKHLAEQAAELASKHPVLDPKARELAEKIKREQTQATQELNQLAQQSEPLKQALQQARAEESRQLSERARELAQAQRDLARAENNTERQRLADRLTELARKQQELAEQEAKLARETRPSLPAARTTPLKPEEAERAAEALKQGNPQVALRHQDLAANDLERLAQAYERAVKVSADPKEAARQLEEAEKSLRQRVQQETARKDSKQPLPERLRPLQEEQKAIRQAAEQLSIPPYHAQAKQLKQQIADRAAQAAEALQKQDAPRAQAQMEETRNLLHRLADALPNLEQRRQQARREVERVRRQQEEIGRLAELSKKDDASATKRLADAARSQADAAEALSKMDAPNQEERRDRTAEALTRALADLLDGRREDVAASQQEARRHLERLEQALRGEKPVDERAQELARKQRELARQAARAAADAATTPQQKQELQRQQQQVAEQTRNLPASEAAQRQREAAEAAQRAAQASQAQPASPETQKRMEEAARKLDELARQLAGEESDAARAERLAQRQAEAAAEAERQAGKPASAEAQRRQQEIAREARDVRGGDEAPREKQRAREALQRTQEAGPKEQAAAQREAADALRDLADRLAGRDDPAAKANEIARRQRELAQAAANAKPDSASAEEAKRAAEQQADLKRRLERLDSAKAGQAAKEAAEKMGQAAAALEKAPSPSAAKEALARAAEAAEKTAAQLGKAQTAKKPPESSGQSTSAKPDQSPREMAKQMAAQQRQMAQATQKAAGSSSTPGGKEAMQKAMQALARQQGELNRQASQLPASQAQRGLEHARASMNRAEQALARNDAAKAQSEQKEAADRLERLAERLPAQAPPLRLGQPQQLPRSLPSQEQSEQARQLARQQRELRDALQRAAQTAQNQRPVVRENPVEELLRRQADVARQAADLARNVGQEQGEKTSASQQADQARQTAQQAARQMQAGALPQARQAGQQAAEQLRQLAAQLARTPRPGDPQTPDPLQQARQLGQQQEEINRRLQPLAADARAQSAQQQAQQRQLQKDAGELAQQFQRLTQESRTSWPMQSALQRATGNSQQAQQAMQQAQQQSQQGAAAAEKQSQERAAQELDRAAQAASDAAKASQQASAKPGSPASGEKSGSPKTGEAVAKASQQMSAAQGQLNQGKAAQAQSAMQQAAQSLAQAAQQMAAAQQQSAQPGQPGQPTGRGRQAGGLPDLSAYGVDKNVYAGKSWGELPGELRTKIIQDMKARYGDDYARMIKYYFEQIADTQKK